MLTGDNEQLLQWQLVGNRAEVLPGHKKLAFIKAEHAAGRPIMVGDGLQRCTCSI